MNFQIGKFTVEQMNSLPGQVLDWGTTVVAAPEVWKYTRGEGVTVAILDTGVDYNHPDLASNIMDGVNFTSSDQRDFMDRNGHGTHVAGIVAGADNGQGIVGIAPRARILIVKVLGDNGSGSLEAIQRGLVYAAERADIISMSLGTDDVPPESFHDAFRYIVGQKGCLVVAAAGNEAGPVNYPAAYDEVISVAALSPSLNPAGFSNRGEQNEVAAPGVNIVSTYPGGKYAILSGTSMATPIVTGVLALGLSYLRKQRPGEEIRPAVIRQMLSQASVDLGKVGRDEQYGFGLINALRLVGQEA